MSQLEDEIYVAQNPEPDGERCRPANQSNPEWAQVTHVFLSANSEATQINEMTPKENQYAFNISNNFW